MKGSVFRRGSVYAVRYDIGDSVYRTQKYKGGFKTKREAQEYLNKVLTEIAEGSYVKPNKLQLNDFIIDWYHKSYKRSVAETTAETRLFYIEKHIIPFFGIMQLQNITTKFLDDFYNEKISSGLSPKTVREFHNILRRAFSQAVKWSLIKYNPVLDATPPVVTQKEIQPWSKDQTKKFLELLETQQREPIFDLIIFTGLRKGEALGLKWEDIDFQRGKIRVIRSLARTKEKGLFLKDVKTQNSKRQVSITPYITQKLIEHREKQSDKIGAKLNNLGMVFCTAEGNFKDPRNLLREFNQLIKEVGLPKTTIHDLRHLHATQLMINGVNPKVVQERLGHSRVSITLDLYSHVNEDLQVEAAKGFEQNLFS